MRIKRTDQSWFVADFETTGLNEYERTGRTRVWLYAVCDCHGDIVNYGATMEEFMDWCSKNHGSLIYFHNLKFDGAFIMSWLMEHDFQHSEVLKAHAQKGFSTLIGDMGEFYQMKINFKANCQVVIYDSLKLIPMPVREIAKAFKLPYEKGKIDYSDYTINDETLDYVFRDVKIVALALKFFRDKGYYRMTIGSNAFHSFKDNNVLFKKFFPTLEKAFIDRWRHAYRGGRSQVNPKYQCKILHNVKRYDLNSMYPSIMAYKYLPYGEPIYCDKPGKYRFELYKLKIHFKLKEGHLPCVLRTGSLFSKAGDTYYINTEGIIDLDISSLDLMLLKRHYDVFYIKYVEIVGFKTVAGIFSNWVKQMYELKSNSEGGLRLVYKLLLNSLYGKFGSKTSGKNKIPLMLPDGTVAFSLSEEHDMGLYYLPVAIAITSWAHVIIDDAIMTTGVDNFVYCDTDSVHTLGTLPDEIVDNKELGKFKLEGTEEICKYVRQKTYIYYDGQWNITCAGMPYTSRDYIVSKYGDNVINQFDYGLSISLDDEGITPDQLKLTPKRVPGGMILVPSPYSIN